MNNHLREPFVVPTWTPWTTAGRWLILPAHGQVKMPSRSHAMSAELCVNALIERVPLKMDDLEKAAADVALAERTVFDGGIPVSGRLQRLHRLEAALAEFRGAKAVRP